MERARRSIFMFVILIKRSNRFSVFSFSLLSLALCLIMPTLGEATVEGIPCTPEPTNMPIEYGDLITCSIDPSGDTDKFLFSGTTGERVVLQVAWGSGALRPCIELYDPDGVLMWEACDNAFCNRIDTQLSKTGIHTIFVEDWFGTSIGEYKLDLERIAPPSPNAQPIQYGEVIPGEINPGGDIDLYRFEGMQPDRVVLQVAWGSGALRPCIELYDPDGDFMEEACDNAFSNTIDTPLSKTGTHTVLVKDWFCTSAGEYSLNLQCIGVCGMHTLSVDKAGTGFGTITSSDGKINCGSDCVAIYNAGAGVTLTAEEDPGSIFVGWSGGGCSGTGFCEITMNADAVVTATFTEAPTTLTLLSPNGGEVIPSGSTYTIQWEAPSWAVSFKLLYSLKNGAPGTWVPIANNVPGTSQDWIVPTPRNNKTKCRVKVIGYDFSEKKVGADRSDRPFTIEVVKLTSPNGGETLPSGDIPTITWTTHETKRDVSRVILNYTKNGGNTWNKIDTLDGNPGSYDGWTVPDVPKTKSKCKVKVVLKDARGNTVGSDVSDASFTISPP